MATYPSDSSDDAEAQLIRLLVQGADLDAGADLEGGAGIGPDGDVGDVADLAEVVGVDGHGAGARGLCVEVVALVLDDQAQVCVAGEVDGQLDLGDVGGVDDVAREAPERALAVGVVRDQASPPLVEVEVDAAGRVDSVGGGEVSACIVA